MADDQFMTPGDDGVNLGELLRPALQRWRAWLGLSLAAGVVGYAASFLLTPQFTSTTTFIPPQQQRSMTSTTLASLGGLAGLAGGALNIKIPAEEYISLMQSVTVADRLIDRFKLMSVYDMKYRVDARKALAQHVSMGVGKKDGLISVSVEDDSPARAAELANRYVEELRWMTSVLAVTEAQQRRVFFERQMKDAQASLITAQAALQEGGVGVEALKAEPKAAADEYAHLRAEAAAAEVRLETLRTSLAPTSPQVITQSAELQALREQLGKLEAKSQSDARPTDYVTRYREFKYQETLFDLLARQYESARVDEAYEGSLIQVVDVAHPAERRSSPKRSLIALGCAFAAALVLGAWFITRRPRPAPKR